MSKYHARVTYRDNIRFQSAREAEYYTIYKSLQQAGEICELELQPRYDIRVNGKYIAFYKADFRYKTVASGRVHVIDAKGFRTPDYKLKKKLVEALYSITIEEV